jgi:hypothetical protein
MNREQKNNIYIYIQKETKEKNASENGHLMTINIAGT